MMPDNSDNSSLSIVPCTCSCPVKALHQQRLFHIHSYNLIHPGWLTVISFWFIYIFIYIYNTDPIAGIRSDLYDAHSKSISIWLGPKQFNLNGSQSCWLISAVQPTRLQWKDIVIWWHHIENVLAIILIYSGAGNGCFKTEETENCHINVHPLPMIV